MAAIVYLLCTLSSILCTYLVFRTYRASGARFLLSCTIGFSGLAVANAILFIDLLLVPGVDMLVYRQLTTFISLLALVWGFVWETR